MAKYVVILDTTLLMKGASYKLGDVFEVEDSRTMISKVAQGIVAPAEEHAKTLAEQAVAKTREAQVFLEKTQAEVKKLDDEAAELKAEAGTLVEEPKTRKKAATQKMESAEE